MIEKDEIVKTSILEAATKVFQKWGLHKTTMEDIAHAAGKGKSTLYYYFKSKEEIFHTIATQEITNITRLAEEAMSKTAKAKDKLQTYISMVSQEIHERTVIYSILVGEITQNTQLIDRIQKNFNETETRLLEKVLQLGVETGEFKSLSNENIAKAATLLVTIIRSFEVDLIVNKQIQDVGAYSDLLSGILLNGLKS